MVRCFIYKTYMSKEKEKKQFPNVYIPDTKEGREMMIKSIDHYFPESSEKKDV